MDVGKRIIELREKRGISTNKLANLAGITQSYLRNIEIGKTNPTVEMLEYICEALNISIRDFFEVNETNELTTAIASLTEKQKSALLIFINSMK